MIKQHNDNAQVNDRFGQSVHRRSLFKRSSISDVDNTSLNKVVSVHNINASANMNLSELQKMAKNLGIQFIGVNKSHLVQKINSYS